MNTASLENPVVLFPFSFGTPSLSAVCLDCILAQFSVSISGLSAPYISKSDLLKWW